MPKKFPKNFFLKWDVAVDQRVDSETFGQWYGLDITGENKTMFYIPTGFTGRYTHILHYIHVSPL